MIDKLTDKQVGEIWNRALHGWRVYADEQELEVLQLISKLVEECVDYFLVEHMLNNKTLYTSEGRQWALSVFGIPVDEYNDLFN
jgi:hypothetical protein